MSLGMLKHCVFEALDNDPIYGDDLSIVTFINLVQQLFDAGLMLTAMAEPFDVSFAHDFANLYSKPIRLGVQLHDVTMWRVPSKRHWANGTCIAASWKEQRIRNMADLAVRLSTK
jgi:hypothetical protein